MYDPLVHKHPGSHDPLPNSFWCRAPAPDHYPSLEHDVHTDYLIIGGGYTGLSAAWHLAQKGEQVTVLEANLPGYGCSGRNAGFVIPGTGRLSVKNMEKKWGKDTAKAIYDECRQGVETVKSLIEISGQTCGIAQGGYLRLAHSKPMAIEFTQWYKTLTQEYGDNVELIGRSRLTHFIGKQDFYTGLYYPDYFSVNPYLLIHTYYQLAQQAGAQIFVQSPVLSWQKEQGHYRVTTARGSILTKQLIFATNAYLGKELYPDLQRRHFPVLSSILVTQALTEQQLNELAMQKDLMVMDTRPMKYYYRLLPENRILFGGRGSVAGKDSDSEAAKTQLLDACRQTLHQVSGLYSEYFWSGWVNIAADQYPRIWHDKDQGIAYAGGYCGSGIAFSAQAGKRLAQILIGDNPLPDLPFWQSPLPKYRMRTLRRPLLKAYYRLHGGR
jgi:glycine/D-amino acid oxidase-like deaminating enzyme